MTKIQIPNINQSKYNLLKYTTIVSGDFNEYNCNNLKIFLDYSLSYMTYMDPLAWKSLVY